MAESATVIGVREPILLTVDLGGTNMRAARGGEYIKPDAIEYRRTPRDYAEAIGMLALMGREVLQDDKADCVGICIAAAPDENGTIRQAGELHSWVGKPITQDIASELGISSDRVVLLNDCVAGAYAERVARKPKDGEMGSFDTLSTGFGATLYTRDKLIPDEPGHHHLRYGAICGDGVDGHIEAHIGGAGIARKFGVPPENIPHNNPWWQEIKRDFHNSMTLTLERYEQTYGKMPGMIGFTGSVALGGPNMLDDLQQDLTTRFGNKAPHIEEAIYRADSGLYGAAFAADELLRSA